MTIGAKVDELAALKARYKKVSGEAARLEAEIKAMDIEITALLDAEGTPMAGGKLGKVKIDEAIVPSVKDWDAFYAYIFRTKGTHLLERRPTIIAYREELEARRGKPIPGVESFKRRTLKFTPTA